MLSASRAWSYREENCPPEALLLYEDTGWELYYGLFKFQANV